MAKETVGALTPEQLGRWLVGRQREIYEELVNALLSDQDERDPSRVTPELVTELSLHSYALQVAIVAITYNQILDDSRFFSGRGDGDVPIEQFLSRVQAGAQEESKPYMLMSSGRFDPLPVAGCALDVEMVMPHVLLYYSAFFAPLESLSWASSDAIEFAKSIVQQMGTTSPLGGPLALAYFFAFQKIFMAHEMDGTSFLLTGWGIGTWDVWSRFFPTFQRSLIEFHGTRSVAFA